MSLQQIKKEIQGIKETVKERPLKVLMQTNAKDMTDAEIDRLVQEVPVHQLPTDVLVAVLDREIDKVNAYLGHLTKYILISRLNIVKYYWSAGKMSLQQIKNEIQEPKNSIITQYEPLCKIFVFRENGFTDEGETEDDLKAYVAAHPHTHVLKLIRKSCRKA